MIVKRVCNHHVLGIVAHLISTGIYTVLAVTVALALEIDLWYLN